MKQIIFVLSLALRVWAYNSNSYYHNYEQTNYAPDPYYDYQPRASVQVIDYSRGCPKTHDPLCATNGQHFLLFENPCQLEVRNYEELIQGRLEYTKCAMNLCHQPQCRTCPDIIDPICAVDINTQQLTEFKNFCEMEFTACSMKRNYRFQFHGLCTQRPQRPLCPIACPKIYQPICARFHSEIREFANGCEFERAKCESNIDWTVIRLGPCTVVNNDLNPVCAAYRGEKKTFQNLLQMELETQVTGKTWIVLHNGHCEPRISCSLAIFRPICAMLNLNVTTFRSPCHLHEEIERTGKVWSILHFGICGTFSPNSTTPGNDDTTTPCVTVTSTTVGIVTKELTTTTPSGITNTTIGGGGSDSDEDDVTTPSIVSITTVDGGVTDEITTTTPSGITTSTAGGGGADSDEVDVTTPSSNVSTTTGDGGVTDEVTSTTPSDITNGTTDPEYGYGGNSGNNGGNMGNYQNYAGSSNAGGCSGNGCSGSDNFDYRDGYSGSNSGNGISVGYKGCGGNHGCGSGGNSGNQGGGSGSPGSGGNSIYGHSSGYGGNGGSSRSSGNGRNQGNTGNGRSQGNTGNGSSGPGNGNGANGGNHVSFGSSSSGGKSGNGGGTLGGGGYSGSSGSGGNSRNNGYGGNHHNSDFSSSDGYSGNKGYGGNGGGHDGSGSSSFVGNSENGGGGTLGGGGNHGGYSDPSSSGDGNSGNNRYSGNGGNHRSSAGYSGNNGYGGNQGSSDSSSYSGNSGNNRYEGNQDSSSSGGNSGNGGGTLGGGGNHGGYSGLSGTSGYTGNSGYRGGSAGDNNNSENPNLQGSVGNAINQGSGSVSVGSLTSRGTGVNQGEGLEEISGTSSGGKGGICMCSGKDGVQWLPSSLFCGSKKTAVDNGGGLRDNNSGQFRSKGQQIKGLTWGGQSLGGNVYFANGVICICTGCPSGLKTSENNVNQISGSGNSGLAMGGTNSATESRAAAGGYSGGSFNQGSASQRPTVESKGNSNGGLGGIGLDARPVGNQGGSYGNGGYSKINYQKGGNALQWPGQQVQNGNSPAIWGGHGGQASGYNNVGCSGGYSGSSSDCGNEQPQSPVPRGGRVSIWKSPAFDLNLQGLPGGIGGFPLENINTANILKFKRLSNAPEPDDSEQSALVRDQDTNEISYDFLGKNSANKLNGSDSTLNLAPYATANNTSNATTVTHKKEEIFNGAVYTAPVYDAPTYNFITLPNHFLPHSNMPYGILPFTPNNPFAMGHLPISPLVNPMETEQYSIANKTNMTQTSTVSPYYPESLYRLPFLLPKYPKTLNSTAINSDISSATSPVFPPANPFLPFPVYSPKPEQPQNLLNSSLSDSASDQEVQYNATLAGIFLDSLGKKSLNNTANRGQSVGLQKPYTPVPTSGQLAQPLAPSSDHLLPPTASLVNKILENIKNMTSKVKPTLKKSLTSKTEKNVTTQVKA